MYTITIDLGDVGKVQFRKAESKLWQIEELTVPVALGDLKDLFAAIEVLEQLVDKWLFRHGTTAPR